ncbi:MAG TPA: TraR/DksA C4-type zinc finger protein [Candidatus Glassbacteria bacterium]|nr:TraR/DksA C4-type zinc finger protein [Candidatus Glassbacteria bacterium]
MDAKEKKIFEKRLLEQRAKILEEMGNFGESYQNNLKESSGDLSSYSFHMADQGTDAENQERAYQQMSKEGRLLYHIDEALRRLYNSPTYGICESCQKPIERSRLELVPHARLCFECKANEENGG